MIKKTALVVLLFILSLPCFADRELDEIDQLMHNNQLQQAKPLLQKEIGKGNYQSRYIEYLAHIYQIEGDFPKAISTLQKGIEISENPSSPLYNSRYMLFYHLGNIYRNMKSNAESEIMYSKAIECNHGFSFGYLNRATVRTDLGKWQEAIDDCNNYLKLVPDAPQKEDILALIDALNGRIASDAEARRLAEEAARLADEERRKREEEARRLEEERQRKLLEAILSSLENASEDTRNLSAGTEGIIIDDDEDDDDELAE
ncbi:MAG: hypothetical protein JW874_01230 [Spirochaetales bacterium]|nr:hypothetical protein [Spirochaetales bacterium]